MNHTPNPSELMASICPSQASAELLQAYLSLLASQEEHHLQARLLKELVMDFVALERRVKALLHNTLPAEVADEIQYSGSYAPRQTEVSILFTDFVGFTGIAEQTEPVVLLRALDRIFAGFDQLVLDYGGTKIKTIGDAYMAVFGAPQASDNHACNAVAAALAMQEFLQTLTDNPLPFQMRAGIHTGLAVTGVVGLHRQQFDVFGDTVNIAARLESAGAAGKVNISDATKNCCGDRFTYIARGNIALKNKAAMAAYFVQPCNRNQI